MTKAPPKDIGASVRARLSRLSRERAEDFQLVLTRYANERLLFRLGSSRHAPRFVLKGAALFTLWTGRPHRATRDLRPQEDDATNNHTGRTHAGIRRGRHEEDAVVRVRTQGGCP